jgi:hypothetical protein
MITEQLLKILGLECQPLFGILDAARDPMIFKLLLDSNEGHQSLHQGLASGIPLNFAPYIVQLSPHSKLLGPLVQKGWGKSWGVYLTAQTTIDNLRRHLRSLLVVRTDGGEELYFRFYDPRVLRVFLPTCTADELSSFFGPIQTYLVEDDDTGGLLRFVDGRQRHGNIRRLPSD